MRLESARRLPVAYMHRESEKAHSRKPAAPLTALLFAAIITIGVTHEGLPGVGGTYVARTQVRELVAYASRGFDRTGRCHHGGDGLGCHSASDKRSIRPREGFFRKACCRHNSEIGILR